MPYRVRSTVFGLLAATVAGCTTASRVRSIPAPIAPAGTLAPFAPQPEGALANRVAAASTLFAERGARIARERKVVFVTEQPVRAATVQLAHRGCIGFAAVARESVTDVDLWVFNRAGVRIAQDVRDDAHPFVRVCGTNDEAYHVVVAPVRGRGEVAVLFMADPPPVAPDLDAVLGVRAGAGMTGPRTPRAQIGDDPIVLDPGAALERTTARIAPLGYRRVGAVHEGTLSAERVENRRVRLEPGRCYAIAAAGEGALGELALRVSHSIGIAIAEDARSELGPMVRFCTVSGDEYVLTLRAAENEGRFAYATFVMDPAIEPADDIVGLTRASVLELAGEGRRRGMTLVRAPVRALATATEAIRFPFPLRPGRCYLFGAAASEGVAGIEMGLFARDGALLSAVQSSQATARVFYCAGRAQLASVAVRAAGRGEVAFVAFEGGEGRRP